jgi:two-component system, chemotaxis family, CheB/CheR fusion protein
MKSIKKKPSIPKPIKTMPGSAEIKTSDTVKLQAGGGIKSANIKAAESKTLDNIQIKLPKPDTIIETSSTNKVKSDNFRKKIKNTAAKSENFKKKQDKIKLNPDISKSYLPSFPIVGIGASAGGLESFEEFFHNIISDSGIAFILVSHLDPTHASMLTEILQRCTAMPVLEVRNNMSIEPNHVYVIPPNWDMTIFHGVLQLVTPGKIRGQRMPIDYFFRSLAEDLEESAIGIILSGTGTDGTFGLRDIIGAGGTTFVQDPATARYDGMPSNAVRNNLATYVLSVDKIPAKLLSCIKNQFKKSTRKFNISADSTIYDTKEILKIIRSATTHDFSLYKQTTVGRRIERRMEACNVESIDEYARYLRGNPDETQILFKELLINVTNFFRDTEAFDVLKREIFSQMFSDKPADYCFRIWVPAASSGEEAYSIAICLREYMDEINQDFKIQIYSTDISKDSIDTARAGVYPENITIDVSPERLKKFFIKEGNYYRVKKEIREMITFAVQNVINDPPFIKLDFISCRNLLIYLEPQLQKMLVSVFSYALKPAGILFLGPAETIGSRTDLFTPISKKHKFYKVISSNEVIHTELFGNYAFHDLQKKEKLENIKIKMDVANLEEIANRELLKSYAPSSVVTDESGLILFVHGKTGKYLSPAPGLANLNVIEMALKELKLKISTGIRNAVKQKKEQEFNNITVETDNGKQVINLIVKPITESEKSPVLLMISFQEMSLKQQKNEFAMVKLSTKEKELKYIDELEKELAYERENLNAIIEESQASNEELKSTNEELQSTNEELQSTNEELDTSREEMQSVNEELVTVNSELTSKIDQLAEAQNDLKNLLENVNVGTIFLDVELKIKRFTKPVTNLFHLIPSDIGRPLEDIKPEIIITGFIDKARYSIEMFTSHEEELSTRDGKWYLMRILPYRTTEEVVEGVVITFTDVTLLKNIESSYKDATELSENIFNTIRQPLLILDKDLRVVSANKSFYDFFKVKPEETINNLIYDLGNKEWNNPSLRKLLEEILPKKTIFEDYDFEHEFSNIGRKLMRLNARIIFLKESSSDLILIALEDITVHRGGGTLKSSQAGHNII